MAKLSIVAGATSQSCNLFLQDKTKTDGSGLSAVAPAGGALLPGTTCYYSFSGSNAAPVAVSLSVLATVGSAWSTGGIVTLDDTHMQGQVRFDIPNAALAASKGRSVTFHFYNGTNMAMCPLEIELTGWDNQDAVRGGLTALPNVASGSAGAIPTTGAGANQIDVASGRINVGKWLDQAVTVDANNAPNVSTKYWGGTIIVATSLPVGVAAGASGGMQINGVNAGAVSYTGGITINNGVSITNGVVVTGGVSFNNSNGVAFLCNSTGGNGHGFFVSGNGSGDGFECNGGVNGRGIHAAGGSASLEGFFAEAVASGYAGARFLGVGAAGVITSGLSVTGNTDLTGVVTATNASNHISGIDVGFWNNVAVGALATIPDFVTGMMQDATAGNYTVNNSFGKSVYTGIAPGSVNGLSLVGSAMTLTSGERSSIFAAFLAGVYAGSHTMQNWFKRGAAVLWGQSSGFVGGAGTGPGKYFDEDDNVTARVTATTDISGNRTSVTTNGS